MNPADSNLRHFSLTEGERAAIRDALWVSGDYFRTVLAERDRYRGALEEIAAGRAYDGEPIAEALMAREALDA